MRLQYKIFFAISIVVIVMIGIMYVIFSDILMRSYIELEKGQVIRNSNRAENALNALIENLHTKSSDWANWDDTYKFITDNNTDYIESNLQSASLVNLKINFILYLDVSGNVVHKVAVDLKEGNETHFPESLIEYINKNKMSFSLGDENKSYSGLLKLPEGTTLLSIRPILTSNITGPVHGTLAFGQYMSEDMIDALSRNVNVKLEFKDVIQAHEDPEINKIFSAQIGDTVQVIPKSKAVYGYKLIHDIEHKPVLVERIEMPREVYQQGLKTLHYYIVILFAAFILLTLVILLSLHKLVISRLDLINKQIHGIGINGDFTSRLRIDGKDEFAHLGSVINEMLVELDKSQKKHRDTGEQLYYINKLLEEKVQELRRANVVLKSTQEQLLQSQKLDSIGKLAGGIAHDFNNLLAGILGYAMLLKEKFKNVDARVFRQLEVIESSALRGEELTKQLLGFARKGKYEMTRVNINESVNETCKLVSRSFSKNIIIQTKLEPGLRGIQGDSTQILQVLMNMCVNARDAMPDGGTITIETKNVQLDEYYCRFKQELVPGQYVVLTVTDTGMGIPEEIKMRIFDPFFTTKDVGKGTGLGLSMVYGIMQNHGGVITVYSEAGQGTIFTMYFPVIDAEKNSSSETPLPITAKADINSLPRINTPLSSVMVVDDEPFMRDLASDIFHSQFNNIQNGNGSDTKPELILACDGLEAVEVFKNNSASIRTIVMDVIMPNMDGITAYEEIRKLSSSVKVIFASGYAESDRIALLRKTERVDFIQKPYTLSDLMKKINAD